MVARRRPVGERFGAGTGTILPMSASAVPGPVTS
jgi:hypothetical protein